MRGDDMSLGCVDSDTSLPFFLVFIHEEGKVKTCLAVLLCHFLLFLNGVLVNVSHFVKQMAHQCALSCINVSNNNHVHLPFSLFFVYVNLVINGGQWLVQSSSVQLLELLFAILDLLCQIFFLVFSPDVILLDVLLLNFMLSLDLFIFEFDLLFLVALSCFFKSLFPLGEFLDCFVDVIFILDQAFAHLRVREVISEVVHDALHDYLIRLLRFLLLHR